MHSGKLNALNHLILRNCCRGASDSLRAPFCSDFWEWEEKKQGYETGEGQVKPLEREGAGALPTCQLLGKCQRKETNCLPVPGNNRDWGVYQKQMVVGGDVTRTKLSLNNAVLLLRQHEEHQGLSERGGVSATTSPVLPVRELGSTDPAQLPRGWVGGHA